MNLEHGDRTKEQLGSWLPDQYADQRQPGKLCGAAWARGRRSRSSSCEAGYLTINLINDNQGSSAEVLGAWQEKMRSSRCAAGYLTDKLTNDNWRSSVEQLGCVAGGNV